MKEEQDKLEQLIAQQREAFDYFEPDPALWQRIQQQLDAEQAQKPAGGRIIRLRPFALRAAAAVVVLISATLAYRWATGPAGADTDSGLPVTQVNLAEVSPELADADAYYSQEINGKRKEIAQLVAENPAMVRDFERDIQQLDSMYVVLKRELGSTPDKAKIADAMIENLQIRIDILNQQLNILQRVRNAKNQKNNENKPAL